MKVWLEENQQREVLIEAQLVILRSISSKCNFVSELSKYGVKCLFNLIQQLTVHLNCYKEMVIYSNNMFIIMSALSSRYCNKKTTTYNLIIKTPAFMM